MKSKKVLIGLILAAFVGTAAISVAQTKANYQNDLIEIGPDNFAGRVRAIVADNSDSTHQTLYAGGVAGGLYKWAPGASSWEFVPCMINGKQVTLPVSYLHQTEHDNMIYVATGEGMEVGANADPAYIIPEGRGLFQFNPEDASFTLVSGTAGIKYINRLASLYRDGKLSLYVGANDGLYLLTDNGSGFAAPQKVFNGPVQDIEIVSPDNMAFFTSGGSLYKISDVERNTTPVDITSTCASFGANAMRIELASAKNEATYLYATVTNNNGLLEGVFLTTNQTQWTRLTTSTITPFNKTVNGWHASSITIDPTDIKRILVGGVNIWVGKGYVPGSYYQWTVSSSAGDLNNGGDFMELVLPNPSYVHSGIHEILPVRQIVDGDSTWIFYLATDGGVFRTNSTFSSFTNMNQGLNTIQFNALAVAPDASLLGGAVGNACTFIQSRNGRDGASINNTWYDTTTSFNHSASILWFGDGGQVEATMFQQITPQSRRGFFFSSRGSDFIHETGTGSSPVANYGRAYADYFDYNNTQTWTSGTAFLADAINETNEISQMTLFETLNNQADDAITFTIDTLGQFIRDGQLTSFQDYEAVPRYPDSLRIGTTTYHFLNFDLRTGDSLIVPSKGHFNYPFRVAVKDLAAFSGNSMDVVRNLTHRVHNPIASRIFVSGTNSSGKGYIKINMTPTDYSRVYSVDEASNTDITMNWYTVFEGNRRGNSGKFDGVGYMAPVSDGDALYFQVVDTSKIANWVLGVTNLNACRTGDNIESGSDINYFGLNHITSIDTIFLAGNGQYKIQRPITSLTMHQRGGKDYLLVTCGGEGSEPNLYLVEVVRGNHIVRSFTVQGGIPLYSALLEQSTGHLFVGSANGVFKSTNNGTSWTEYGDFDGVPVTAIRQQTRNLPNQRVIGHSGINEERYLFARTKFPGAIYFGTYGRGIFMDMSYVSPEATNEIADEDDYNWASISNVDNGLSSLSVYPNPATDYAIVDMLIANEGNASIRVYDLTGRCVVSENLGRVSEGSYSYQLNTSNLRRGMYLINVTVAGKTATKKLVVK